MRSKNLYKYKQTYKGGLTMAKINETVFVVKVSELVRDSEESRPVLNDDAMTQLEAVVKELAGPKALVELEKA